MKKQLSVPRDQELQNILKFWPELVLEVSAVFHLCGMVSAVCESHRHVWIELLPRSPPERLLEAGRAILVMSEVSGALLGRGRLPS